MVLLVKSRVLMKKKKMLYLSNKHILPISASLVSCVETLLFLLSPLWSTCIIVLYISSLFKFCLVSVLFHTCVSGGELLWSVLTWSISTPKVFQEYILTIEGSPKTFPYHVKIHSNRCTILNFRPIIMTPVKFSTGLHYKW